MLSFCLGEQLSFPSTPDQNLNVSEFIWAKHRFKVVTTWSDQALVWNTVFLGSFTLILGHTEIRAVKSAIFFTTTLSFFCHCLFLPTLRKSCLHCLECSSSCYLACYYDCFFLLLSLQLSTLSSLLEPYCITLGRLVPTAWICIYAVLLSRWSPLSLLCLLVPPLWCSLVNASMLSEHSRISHVSLSCGWHHKISLKTLESSRCSSFSGLSWLQVF